LVEAFFAVFFLAAMDWLLRVASCWSVRRMLRDTVYGAMQNGMFKIVRRERATSCCELP
jgi:hypothetical protein